MRLALPSKRIILLCKLAVLHKKKILFISGDGGKMEKWTNVNKIFMKCFLISKKLVK